MESHDAKASIEECKNQMKVIKKLLGINKGVESYSGLKNSILSLQNKFLKNTPIEREHRILNVFVSNYLEKLSLQKVGQEMTSISELLTVDFTEL